MSAQALRAALQQSFQLLLDGFLVLLNEGLGADPVKGRAAAAQAAKILRKIRVQLWTKASAKLVVLQDRIRQEAAKASMSNVLDNFTETASGLLNEAADLSGVCRSSMQWMMETGRSKLPEEDQKWLPGHLHVSFVRDHLLIGAWLALLVRIAWKMLRLALRAAFRGFLVWPCRCSWAVCRYLALCILCRCRRKAVEQPAEQVMHANGSEAKKEQVSSHLSSHPLGQSSR